MNKIFEYGGKHFKPVGVMTPWQRKNWWKVIRQTDMDYNLRFWKTDEIRSGLNALYKWDCNAFYRACGERVADFFECIETGLIYLPCEWSLFIYTGGKMKELEG